MATRRAWVLNLDADLELAGGPGYTPNGAVRRAVEANAERLAATLLGPDDVRVDERSLPGVAAGLPGRAFCPTPRAIALLRKAGAEPEPHPPVEVLRRVNGRGFAAGLGQTLPDAMFLVDEADVVSRLAHPPSVGTAWRVKHAHGMAGRNQRVVAPGGGSPDDLRFVRRGLAAGGVQLEPQVSIEAEYALHGFVAGDGAVRTGALVRQRCDARGAWLATEPVDAAEGAGVLAGVRDRMGGEVTRVAAALVAAGYAGPFGVDGYLYRGREGALCLQPRSEINARYSMGYAIGFGRRA